MYTVFTIQQAGQFVLANSDAFETPSNSTTSTSQIGGEGCQGKPGAQESSAARTSGTQVETGPEGKPKPSSSSLPLQVACSYSLNRPGCLDSITFTQNV